MDLQYHWLFLLDSMYEIYDQRWRMIYIMKWSTILHTLPYCIALVLCIELEYAFICSFIHLFNKYLLNMYFVQITLLIPPLSLLPDPSLSSHICYGKVLHSHTHFYPVPYSSFAFSPSNTAAASAVTVELCSLAAGNFHWPSPPTRELSKKRLGRLSLTWCSSVPQKAYSIVRQCKVVVKNMHLGDHCTVASLPLVPSDSQSQEFSEVFNIIWSFTFILQLRRLWARNSSGLSCGWQWFKVKEPGFGAWTSWYPIHFQFHYPIMTTPVKCSMWLFLILE